MHEFQIHSFGSPRVKRHQQDLPFHREGSRDILFYLLAHPEGCTPSKLVRDVWDADLSASVRKRLDLNLECIRAALGCAKAVQHQEKHLQLSRAVLLRSDVARFYQHLDCAWQHTGVQRLGELHVALELCVGPFLQGNGSPWARLGRAEHRVTCLRLLLEVSDLQCSGHVCLRSDDALHKALEREAFMEGTQRPVVSWLSDALDPRVDPVQPGRFLRALNGETPDCRTSPALLRTHHAMGAGSEAGCQCSHALQGAEPERKLPTLAQLQDSPAHHPQK